MSVVWMASEGQGSPCAASTAQTVIDGSPVCSVPRSSSAAEQYEVLAGGHAPCQYQYEFSQIRSDQRDEKLSQAGVTVSVDILLRHQLPSNTAVNSVSIIIDISKLSWLQCRHAQLLSRGMHLIASRLFVGGLKYCRVLVDALDLDINSQSVHRL